MTQLKETMTARSVSLVTRFYLVVERTEILTIFGKRLEFVITSGVEASYSGKRDPK